MDLYNVWFNLKPGIRDTELCERLDAYLGKLVADGQIAAYRISRRKLGFAPPGFGEFHVLIETRDLAQLDSAFSRVASRAGEIESLHAAVNQHVTDFTAALYRDFPDAMRRRGEEQF